MSRPLTSEEYKLAKWLLEHGKPEGLDYLPQLKRAQASSWKCECGCASFDFEIDGSSAKTGGMNILADFLIKEGDFVGGICIWEQNKFLRGVEVSGYTDDAPKQLPAAESLVPI